MQFVADDLDIRPLLIQHGACELLHGLPEGIVLVDKIDLLDFWPALDECRRRLHPHVRADIPTEMPETAFRIGKSGVHGAVVEIEDLLAGVAIVVLAQPLVQRVGDARPTALREDADAFVGGLLGLDQGFLRISLVVERHDFEVLAVDAASGVDFIRNEAVGVQADFADRGVASRQWIDEGDLDRVLRQRGRREQAQRQRTAEYLRFHRFLPSDLLDLCAERCKAFRERPTDPATACGHDEATPARFDFHPGQCRSPNGVPSPIRSLTRRWAADQSECD